MSVALTSGSHRAGPAVKVCGLTRHADAAAAESLGAAYLGVILASGPRLLTPDAARGVIGARRPGVQRVGVFGDQSEAEIEAIALDLALDVVQLHGARTADAVARLASRLRVAVWPVVRLADATIPDAALALGEAAGTVVLDALVPGQLGGTGVALDWAGLSAAVGTLRSRLPALRLVLAGGLRPANVATAIGALSPEVVDVSSGVESAPGLKDRALVQQFVNAVHGTAVRLS